MLRIPDAVQQAMPKGPLARDAALARALLSDASQTSVVLVTLPEELPARETVTLARDIRALGIPQGLLVVNAMPPAEATDPGIERILAASASAAPPVALAGLLADVAVLAARRHDAERIVAGLTGDPGLPMVQIPRLPTNDLGPEEIASLGSLLAGTTLAGTSC